MLRWDQVALLGVEATLVAVLILWLFRQRAQLGLSLLLMVLGGFQFLQSALALSLYVEIAPGVLVSPGSVVLFPAGVFAVLLVYVREDANEARKLIYGLVAANLSVVALSALFGVHFASDATHNFVDLPLELFVQNPRLAIVGSIASYLGVVLVILAYEWLTRRLPKHLFLRVFGALAIVLAFDTVFFATGGFVEKPEYASILVSGLVGKMLAALFYGSVLTIYLRSFEEPHYLLPRRRAEVRDILEVLTFRQTYEALREHAVRDHLTRLYNRSFFDDVFPGEIERAQRFGRPTTVLLMQLDGMPAYVQRHGVEQRDRLMLAVASALVETMRASDIPARLDGDRFAAVLPDADEAAGAATAHRFRMRVGEFCRNADPPVPADILLGIGAATWPKDADSPRRLLEVATERIGRGRADRIEAA